MKPIVDISEALIALGLTDGPSDVERASVLMCLRAAHGAVRRFLKYDPCYTSHVEFYPQQAAPSETREYIWDTTPTTAYQRSAASSAASDELQLKHMPVRSIVSLKIDYDGRSGTKSGAFGAETVKTQGVDFWPNFDMLDSDGNPVCSDGILKSIGLWPQETGSVRVEYYAGYKPAEMRGQDSVIDATSIWEVCLDETTRRFLKLDSRKKKTLSGFAGPLTSESMGDYSYTLNASLSQTLLGGTDLLPESMEKLSDYFNYGIFL